jgi:hypothetical protein
MVIDPKIELIGTAHLDIQPLELNGKTRPFIENKNIPRKN